MYIQNVVAFQQFHYIFCILAFEDVKEDNCRVVRAKLQGLLLFVYVGNYYAIYILNLMWGTIMQFTYSIIVSLMDH